jgi:diguanylate cyclase (GGDEF)-like protein
VYVRFWGTRGSIAAPGQHTARYGGNTSCVEVRAADGTLIVLDCGTGVRELGLHLLKTMRQPLRLHLFIGHTHWDHIQGFPFFGPAFVPGSEVNVYAPLGFQRSLGEAMAGQMEYSYFPVKLKDLRSRIHFTELDEGFFRVGDVLVETQYLNHTAPTIAYRITSGNATLAYVTDHEPFWKPSTPSFGHPGDQRHIAFLKGADLVIHDAQYTRAEYQTRIGWGHSSVEYATDVALAAGVKRLALFHHDPTHDDAAMDEIEQSAKTRVASQGEGLEVFAAREGLELQVNGGASTGIVAESSALRRLPIVGRRVVLVSADQAEIESIEQELADEGVMFLSMPDANTTLRRLREVLPDILIITNQLPDGSGASLIAPARARAGRPDLPVLLITDGLDTDVMPTVGDAAPTDYVARPFSPPMLRARVRAWLSRTLARTESVPNPTFSREAASADATHDGEERPSARYASLLKAMPLFRPLKSDQLHSLVDHAVDQFYGPGHILLREGAPTDALFVIISGRVRVTETSRDTQSEFVLGELGPGEIFGELGIIRNQPRVASVVAIERTHCLVLPPQNFIEAVESSPALAMGLLQILAARLSDADRRLARYAPDPLTGLMSRRAFQDQYRRLAAGARRRRTGALFVVIDVQHLRTLNDQYGYALGDEVLKSVAEALLEVTRTTDLIARYGSDEFTAFLVDAQPKDIEGVVSRILKKIAEAGPRRELPVAIHCALGVTYSAEPPEAPDELLRQADVDMTRRRVAV